MTRATVGFLDERGNFVPVKASRPLPTTGGGGGGIADLEARVAALEALMETAIQGDGTITDLVAKTQAQYDALATKDPTTQYTIKGA